MSQSSHAASAGPLAELWRDVRYGARVLYRKPAFTLIAVFTLALGIGANTAIFSVVNAALLTPIAIPQPDRVVVVRTLKAAQGSNGFPASAPDFLAWQSSGIFESLAGYALDGYSLLVNHRPEHLTGASVTHDWFQVRGIQPYLGRLFNPAEMHAGHDHVVVLTYALWASAFASDPSIAGKSTIINGAPYSILGVLPSRVPQAADEKLYLPLSLDPPLSTQADLRFIQTEGRLAPSVSLAAAQSRIAALSARLEQQYPRENAGNRARLQPIEEAYVQDVHTLIVILFGAVGLVLLIACANIANLLLVRGASRQREIAIRSALGAAKFSIVRQLLTESVLLAILGALAAIIPAYLGIRVLTRFSPDSLPNSDLVSLSPSVLLFTFALAIATGLLSGILPAWEGWRSSGASPLRERSQSSGALRFGNYFVIGEVALTVVLAVAAGLMLSSFLALRHAYPGFDAGVLTMRVSLTGAQYNSNQALTAFYRTLLDRTAQLPGVRAAAAVDCLPTCNDVQGGTLHFVDRPDPAPNNPALVVISSVTPDFFNAMHIPVISGRAFTPADDARAPLTVILDSETARIYWHNQDPIGRSVRLRLHEPLRKIIGIAGPIDRSIAAKMKGRIGQAYVPFEQWPNPEMSLVLASTGDAFGLAPSARRVLADLAPDQPFYDIRTMAQARALGQTAAQFGAWLLGFFAVLSLVLASIGVYGVVSYLVEQRTRELGVRMALGASPHALLLGVLTRGFILIGSGLIIGLAAALALSAIMSSLLYGISATDPATFAGSAALLLLVGLLATFLPAFRASRVSPMVALRHE